MKNIIKTLEILTKQPGITGYESETGITGKIYSIVSKLSKYTEIDSFGNVISYINKSSGTAYLFEAHMDEVGYMIDSSKISNEQYIPLGNIDKDDMDINSLINIFNLKNKRFFSPKRMFKKEDRIIHAVALDNRVGCTVLIELMSKIIESKINIQCIFVFSIGEETDSSRWQNLPKNIYPIVVDAAYAEPIKFKENFEGINIPILGEGCAIQHFGTDFFVKVEERNFLYKIANDNNIKVQDEIPPKNMGRTNFSKLCKFSNGNGVVVNIPVRNQHSSISTTNINDIKSAIDLLYALILSKNL